MTGELVDGDFLAAIDEIRGIPDELGAEPYSVSVRVVTYSGDRVGVGTRTVTDTPVTVAGRRPHVRNITSKEVVASGGLYTTSDLRVGPLTPGYPGGGMTPAQLDPPPTSTATEVYYVITGGDVPSGGVLYRRLEDDMASTTQYFVVLRSLARPATPA